MLGTRNAVIMIQTRYNHKFKCTIRSYANTVQHSCTAVTSQNILCFQPSLLAVEAHLHEAHPVHFLLGNDLDLVAHINCETIESAWYFTHCGLLAKPRFCHHRLDWVGWLGRWLR